MRILVTGAGGHIGSEMVDCLRAKGVDAYGTSRKDDALPADLASREDVARLVRKVNPDCILHCAARSSVELCENNPEAAWTSNVIATKNIADACGGARLIYMSTDYVFDGTRGMYRETDLPNPMNSYGRTKLIGELVAMSVQDAIVVRTSSVLSQKRGSYAVTVLSSLNSGGMEAATDMINSPTLLSELSEALSELACRNTEGRHVYHMAGASSISRYDLALKLAAAFGHDTALVKPVKAAALFRSPRPRDTSLDIAKASSEGMVFSDIDSAIKILRGHMNG